MLFPWASKFEFCAVCQIGMHPRLLCLEVCFAARPVCCWARLFTVAVMLYSRSDAAHWNAGLWGPRLTTSGST